MPFLYPDFIRFSLKINLQPSRLILVLRLVIMAGREETMRKQINLTNGEAELLKDRSHLAYCKYMIKEFLEDNGSRTTEATLTLMREGLREDEFKKLALYFVFNRGDIYNLRFPDGSNRRINLTEFNAFSAEGKIVFAA